MNYQKQVKQLRLDFVHEKEERHIPAKRVDIVNVRMVKECSLMYKDRVVGSLRDGFKLIGQFLGDVGREHFVVVCLDSMCQLFLGSVILSIFSAFYFCTLFLATALTLAGLSIT